MPIEWIVVANRVGARILEKSQATQAMRLLKTFTNQSRLLSNRSRDLEGDHLHVASAFANRVAHYLDSARQKQKFDRLILIAEPKFMGKLRSAISRQTAGKVSSLVLEDLEKVPTDDLSQVLERSHA